MRQSRLILPVPTAATGQETLVTARITDQFGVPYANSYWTATFYDGPLRAGQISLFTPQGLPPNFAFPGSPVTPRSYSGTTDGMGILTQLLWDNSQIWPPDSYWGFRFSDPSGTLHTEVTTQVLIGRPPIIQGGSVDLSALLSGVAKPIPLSSPRTAIPGYPFTVATLPMGQQIGTLAKISDGISPTDTTVGGGSNLVLCIWNGNAWVAVAGGFGGGGPTVTFSFAEVVAGSGTAWTLAIAPNPQSSLQLFQSLPSFGSILLVQQLDYTLTGASITTNNSITAGTLRAWYAH